MSHNPLRKENNCLNCGHTVEERYCSHCGQENAQLNDSVWHLMIHYVQDLFHYDGKLWHTLKNLVLKPGQVPIEFMEGKRKRNLEPIRFYIFSSTVFFLLLFFIVNPEKVDDTVTDQSSLMRRMYLLEEEKKMMGNSPDTVYINTLMDSLEQKMNDSMGNASGLKLDLSLFDAPPDTLANEGWFGKFLREKLITKQTEMEREHEGDLAQALRAYLNKIFHMLPQLFFLSLPFFAFFLMLLYWLSSRKKYIDHFIFSIYHYAYTFVIFMVYMAWGWLEAKAKSETMMTLASVVTMVLVLYPFIYLLLSMKRFYNDRWGILLLRYFTLMGLMVIIILVLSVIIALLALIF